jgi:hypothetical protein
MVHHVGGLVTLGNKNSNSKPEGEISHVREPDLPG